MSMHGVSWRATGFVIFVAAWISVSSESTVECVSHETLKCINAASTFWPRCDPSQSKVDNFPTLHGRAPSDYGHFCTRAWADALNEMLSDAVVNKCGDRDTQIKLLAQIAVETGYFTTLFQPTDGGAGLVHMIPNNWPINSEDMQILFGGDFVERQAAAGATFFQSPSDGWLSVAAWYKRTNSVIPGCGVDLFEEPFDVQTQCIFGRPNNRMEAFDIVSNCLGSSDTTTGPSDGACRGTPCADITLCRSKFGHCGATADHCNSESTWKASGCGSAPSSTSAIEAFSTTSTTSKGSADVTSTTKNSGDPGTCTGTPCQELTHCRSKWGFCGSSLQHCNAESIWKVEGCGIISATTTTSTSSPSFLTSSTTSSLFFASATTSTTTGNSDDSCSGVPCTDVTHCRSQWGFCGSTSHHCNGLSTWKASGCRPSEECVGEPCFSAALCRSKWGHCGSSPQHCNHESTWKANGCRQIQVSSLSLNDTSIHPATLLPDVNDSQVNLSISKSATIFADLGITAVSIIMFLCSSLF